MTDMYAGRVCGEATAKRGLACMLFGQALCLVRQTPVIGEIRLIKSTASRGFKTFGSRCFLSFLVSGSLFLVSSQD